MLGQNAPRSLLHTVFRRSAHERDWSEPVDESGLSLSPVSRKLGVLAYPSDDLSRLDRGLGLDEEQAVHADAHRSKSRVLTSRLGLGLHGLEFPLNGCFNVAILFAAVLTGLVLLTWNTVDLLSVLRMSSVTCRQEQSDETSTKLSYPMQEAGRPTSSHIAISSTRAFCSLVRWQLTQNPTSPISSVPPLAL